MKYSNTTIKELTTRYKHVLMKCAYLNAAIIAGAMIATPAFAAPTVITSGVSNNIVTDLVGQQAGGLTINSTDEIEIADGVTYNANSSVNSGGGIKALNGFTAGNGLVLSGNSTDKIGGGMYIRSSDNSTSGVPTNRDVTIGTGAQITGNSSKWLGGGLAIESADTVTIGDDANFANNSSQTDGGGMAVWTDGSNKVGGQDITSGTTVNLGKTTFKNNTATNRGGAIANLNNDSSTTSYNNTVNVGAGSSFEGNSAQYGGAIYNLGDLNVGNGTSFTNNSGVVGGAIYIHEPGTMTLGDNIVFSGNTADYNKPSNPAAGNVNANGSAIHARNGFTAGNGVQFINNRVTQKEDSTWMGGAIYASLENGDTKTITFGDDTLFKGNTSNASAGAVYLADGANMTFGKNTTFDGNTASKYAGAIMNQNQENVLTFNGDSSFTNNTAGLGGGAIFNNGTIDFKGNTTFANNMANGIKNDIVNNGTLNFGGGVISLDGGITGLNGGKTGTVNFASESTLRVTLMSGAAPFITADTITIAKGAKLDLIVGNGATDGKYTIGDVNTLGNNGQRFELANEENALYSFTQNAENGIYDVTKKSSAAITEALTSGGASVTEAQTIDAMTEAKPTNAQATAIANAITTAAQTGDTAGAAALASAVNPTTTPTIQTHSVGTATQVMNVAGSRMSEQSKGRSGGSMADFQYGPWVQGLYNHTKNTQGDGFKGNSQGFATGVDIDVTDSTMIGAGYAYTATDIKSNGRKTQVYGDNYFLYGKYQPSEWYTSGTLNYGKADYKETSLGLIGKYTVDTYAAQAMVGYQKSIFDNYAGIRYIYVNPESYSNGLTQVASKNSQVGTAVIGTTISKDYTYCGVVWKPEFRLAGTYDLKSDNSSSIVSIVGGSSTYAVNGKRLHRAGLETGLGLTATVRNLDVSVNYDLGLRQDQTSQTGGVKLQYNF